MHDEEIVNGSAVNGNAADDLLSEEEEEEEEEEGEETNLTDPGQAKRIIGAQKELIAELKKSLLNKDNDLTEVRAKFAKNRQILTSNWEQVSGLRNLALRKIYHFILQTPWGGWSCM